MLKDVQAESNLAKSVIWGRKMVGIMENTQRADMHVSGVISMPPVPPGFHLPQRLHPGSHRSLGLQTLYLGNCPYRAVGKFLYEIILAQWRLDVHFPEAHSLGGHCGPGKAGPWIASHADPTGSPLWFLDQRRRNGGLLENLPRDWETRDLAVCRVKGILPGLAMPVPFLAFHSLNEYFVSAHYSARHPTRYGPCPGAWTLANVMVVLWWPPASKRIKKKVVMWLYSFLERYPPDDYVNSKTSKQTKHTPTNPPGGEQAISSD